MRSGGRSELTKRTFDVALASVGLVVTAPLMGVTAAAVWLDSGRPIFFRQERIGRNGVLFTIRKFRSMRPDEAEPGEPRGGGDPSGGDESHRVTRVGRVIRRWAVDELPQLINVLSDDMSLVGPRPLIPEHEAAVGPGRALRRSVKPGMTGWAAVTAGPSRSWEERVARDVYYVDRGSLWMDLAILLLSVPAIASWGEPHGGLGRQPQGRSRVRSLHEDRVAVRHRVS